MDIGRTLPADVGRELLDELIASKALVEAFTQVASEGLIQLDERQRIARFNSASERLLGYAAQSVIGAQFDTLLHESNRTNILGNDPAAPRAATVLLRDSAGETMPVNMRCVAIVREGRPEGWVIAFTRKERVQEIEQLKNELVSTVSHELKTPLASIKAYTATLRQNPELYESRRAEFLGVVEQEADRLSRLIEDMLLVTRVDSAQLLRKRLPVDLDRLLDDAIAQIARNPATHPIERRGTGVHVSGDPERLRDILRNLLENAIKYSPEGGTVEVEAHEYPERTTITIRDRGVGIPDEHIPFIFDRFYRAEDERTQGVGGSGLGLYIVQALVRAHGGTIEARSAGQGSTFTLTFPVRA